MCFILNDNLFFADNAKWLLNVKWQMEGVDIHLDVNIGKQLSALGHTLTSLSGFEEDEPTTMDSPDSDDGDQTEKGTKVGAICPRAEVKYIYPIV